MTDKKLCCEASCSHIYTPDKGEGLCPLCGSQGIWINNTVIGAGRNVFIDREINEILRQAGYTLPKGALKWEE
jgi:Zn finger protein HypA/HybF involved in hydrogenase expression